MDHIDPRSKGGDNRMENLLLAHKGCNEKRGSGPLTEKAEQMRVKVAAFLAVHRAECQAAWEARHD